MLGTADVKQSTLLNTLWFSFFLGVIIYHLIYYYMRSAEATQRAMVEDLLSYALLFLGASCAITLINLDIFFLSRPRTISPEMLPPGIIDKDEKEIVRTLKAHWFRVRFVLCLALAEASGVFGLVVGFLGGNPLVASILFLLSYLMLIYLRLRLALLWQRMYLS